MSIVICALKLMEMVWSLSIGRVSADNMTKITNLECAIMIIFSVAIVIPMVCIICKKIKDKQEYFASSIILIVYTFIWIGISYWTVKFDYPLNLTLARLYQMVSTIVVALFCITKGNEILIKNDIDINSVKTK